jgi:hypothetical protein
MGSPLMILLRLRQALEENQLERRRKSAIRYILPYERLRPGLYRRGAGKPR